MKKLSKSEAEMKKSVGYKKSVYCVLSSAPLHLKKMPKNNEQRYLDLVNLFKKALKTIQTGTRVVEKCKKWSQSLPKENAEIKTKDRAVQRFDHVKTMRMLECLYLITYLKYLVHQLLKNSFKTVVNHWIYLLYSFCMFFVFNSYFESYKCII